MSSFSIEILHLSDVHFRGARENAVERRTLVLDSFLQDVKTIGREHRIDLICLTGDVADWGTADEYRVASQFLKRLLDELALTPDRLFIVPGNHDIHRSTAQPAWEALRQALSRSDAYEVSRWLVGGRAPVGVDPANLPAVLQRQAAYHEWLVELGRAELLPAASPHGKLGFRKTLRLPQRPFDVHIIGLDSAWLAGDDHDAGALRLTEDQVLRLCTDGGQQLAGLRLALIHHPLSELADRTSCQRLLAEHIDLLLRGHLHDVEPSLWADPDRQLFQLAAGCLYEGHRADQYRNGYLLHTLTLDEAGRRSAHEVRFRCRAPNGVWHNDNSLYRSAPNGRLRLSARYIWQHSTTFTAADAWYPSTGPVPAYTDDEHRALGEALMATQEQLEAETIAGQDQTATRETLLVLKRRMRDQPHLREGDLLGEDRFKLVKELGQGGFGSVWQAYDRRRREIVAVKVLHSQWNRDQSRRERFTRGARLMAELRHPHIVHVLDEDLRDERHAGFAMEYLSGGDLQHALRTQDIPLSHVVRIMQEIGSALAFAHERGRVHRDIKPANILLDGGGRAYLTDFDLMWAADTTGGTRTGGMGTFLYAAPELMENASAPTLRADIYSLAMSAVAALSGAPPTPSMVRDAEPFIARLKIPEDARQALRRALNWNPDERFPSMAEFVETFVQGAAEVPPPPPPPVEPVRPESLPIDYLGIFDETDYSRIKRRSNGFARAALDQALCAGAMRWIENAVQRPIPTATLFICHSAAHAIAARDALAAQGVVSGIVFSVGIPKFLPDLHNAQIFLMDPNLSPVSLVERLAQSYARAPQEPIRIIDIFGIHSIFFRRFQNLLLLSKLSRKSLHAFLESPEPHTAFPGSSSFQLDEASRTAIEAVRQREYKDPLIDIYLRQRPPSGQRLTAIEFFRRGYSLKSAGRYPLGWFQLLYDAGALTPREAQLYTQARSWFQEVETTAMTKSFKMVMLQVLIDAGALRQGMPLPDLAERSLERLRNTPEIAHDLDGVKEVVGDNLERLRVRFARYWRDYPVRAWITPRNGHAFFTLEDDQLVPHLPFHEEDEGLFAEMTRELIEYRLAQYIRRGQPGSTAFECKLMTNQRTVILKLPSRLRHPGLPLGDLPVHIFDGSICIFRMMKEYCNYASYRDGINCLDKMMKQWFGPTAGQPGSNFYVRFTEEEEGWHIRAVMPTSA